jgi:hypothetical protein
MSGKEILLLQKEKILNLRQNLIIFKKAVNKSQIDVDKSFDRAIQGLANEYLYRESVEKQLNKYKASVKLAQDAIGTDTVKDLNDAITKEKTELANTLEIYNNKRDVEGLEIANNAMLAENEARGFMLDCMADLIGELMALSDDKSDSLINEAESIVNKTSNN